MDIHPSALNGRTRADVSLAVEHARLTTHVGNAPTQIYMVGTDTQGDLLEITAVVRHEDVFILHATPARPAALGMLRDIESDKLAEIEHEGRINGVSADEMRLTEPLVHELFETADAGYDVDRLLTRTRPGRPAPMTVGTVVRVGLTTAKRDAVSERAEREGVSVEEYIADAVEDLVKTRTSEMAPRSAG